LLFGLKKSAGSACRIITASQAYTQHSHGIHTQTHPLTHTHTHTLTHSLCQATQGIAGTHHHTTPHKHHSIPQEALCLLFGLKKSAGYARRVRASR